MTVLQDAKLGVEARLTEMNERRRDSQAEYSRSDNMIIALAVVTMFAAMIFVWAA